MIGAMKERNDMSSKQKINEDEVDAITIRKYYKKLSNKKT